ncbi:NEW3 domain-containing protein [Brevibacillus fulvus]|uniref:Membrane protein n=1 Tax=Brevibacillus fulvus TaxID=1125967 RepID=A0A938XWR5_9BACL|nr:NEW3 domain-containing protein [Brevibacillus fulvus]MBM7591607.1 putative membrane protein [Brevibacillus fulvus]
MKRIWNKAPLFLILMLALVAAAATHTYAAQSFSLYTPYPSITVTPGESINFSVDVLNNSSDIAESDLQVTGLPANWEAELSADGWSVQQIAVKPNSSQTLTMQVDVPLQVDKGTYHFQLVAGGRASLPLSVTVSEQGTYKTELTSDQPNMEGHAGSTFNYQTTLRNRTAEKQLYALTAEAPQGWDVQFKVDGKAVSSANVDANGTRDISIDITPPEKVKSGSYKIPIKAATNSTTASTELEAVITGSYDLEVTTPSGLLSTDVTAGDEKKLQLSINNTGTADLHDISLSSSAPANWEVTFEPSKITKLEAGKSAEVTATLKADNKAIAGDYVVNVSASAPEASSEAQFRIAVQTSVLWGWLGVLIIVAVIAGVYYLFRTYGRR